MQVVEACLTSDRNRPLGAGDGEIPVASGSVDAALTPTGLGDERGITGCARGPLVMRERAVENAMLLEAQAFVDVVSVGEGIVNGGHGDRRGEVVSVMTIEPALRPM